MKLSLSRLGLGVVVVLLQARLGLAQTPVAPAAPGAPAAAPAAPSKPAAVVPSINGDGPRIQFASPAFNFGRIRVGDQVKYQFVFTNVGDSLLVLNNVRPGCHCTTTGEWTKEVQPGKTGVIPIQFDSTGTSGSVTRSVTVSSNDKRQPMIALQITGTVWREIDINPQQAVLNIAEESPSNATTILHITNNTAEPITISPPESNRREFVAELKTIQPGREFELHITTVPPVEGGNVSGTITLKTSSTNTPVLNIMALAVIQPAIVTMPPRIILQARPLPNAQTVVVTVQNQGTNVLSLSDAAVNAPGVTVTTKEVQPGRQFSLAVNFPQGFDAPPGAMAMTVKTSHPRHREITVPIFQAARPVNFAASRAPVQAPGQTNAAVKLPQAAAH